MGKIKITAFNNPKGSIAYRVSGSVNGKQIREKFKTRSEAVTVRDRYEIKRLNNDQTVRIVASRLSTEEQGSAEAAFKLLKQDKRKKPLTFYVQYAIDHCNVDELTRTVGECLSQYIDCKTNEEGRGEITLI